MTKLILAPGTAKSRRGFAAMDPEKRRAAQAKGGKSIPAEKRTFSVNRELARAAGAKGGHALPADKRTFNDAELAAAAGRKSGEAKRARKLAQ